MPTSIGGQLNNVVVGNFTAAELNGATRPFLAVVLDADPARDVHIYGLDYGMDSAAADRPLLSLIVQIARNFKPDPNVSIFDQIDDGGPGVSPSKLIRPYFRRVETPFDVSDQRTKPIILSSGVAHTIAVGIGLSGAVANGVTPYLVVSGEFVSSARGKSPRPR